MRTILEDISEPVSGFFSEKRSDFYGYAAHITCSADIDIFLQKIRDKHPDARHIVWAALFRDSTYYIIPNKMANEFNNETNSAIGNNEDTRIASGNKSNKNDKNAKMDSSNRFSKMHKGDNVFDEDDFIISSQKIQGVAHEKLSDDGEPSGTGGMPLLNLLKRKNLDNSMIAVARKFGGILLGAGGLTRAYNASAENALAHSKSVDLVPIVEVKTVVNYQQWSSFEMLVYSYCGIIHTTDFAAEVSCSFSIPVDRWNELSTKVQNTYGGKVSVYPQSVQLGPLEIRKS